MTPIRSPSFSLSRSTPYTSTTDLPSFRIEFPVMIWNNTKIKLSKFQGSTNFTNLNLSQLKIPDARSVIWRKFCTEDLDIWGTTKNNSVTLVTWCLRFVHSCRAYPLPAAVLSSSSLWSWFTRPKFLALSLNSCEQNAQQPENRCKYNKGWIIKPCRCEALIHHRTADPYQNNSRQICMK